MPRSIAGRARSDAGCRRASRERGSLHRARTSAGWQLVRAILPRVQAQLQVAGLLGPLRADPARAAALLDIDGTLAPIVRHPSDANVPEPTRARLIELSKRYGLVACVSGRPAAVARQLVGVGTIAY